jgi:ketosteroid isomerase-like protein
MISMVMLFAACESKQTSLHEPDTTTSLISADSLVDKWNFAWNSADENIISQLIAHDCQFMTGFYYLNGRDSITNIWVKSNIGNVINLQSRKIAEHTTTEMVYQSGQWSLNFKQGENVSGGSRGNYTFIWRKQPDNLFRLSLIHLEDLPMN